MHVAVYCPFLASAVLGGLAPRLARRLPPATASRLLAAGGLGAALASASALAVLAFLLVARVPVVADRGHWSAGALAAASPVPAVVAVLALALLAVAAGRTVRLTVARVGAVRAARALCRELGGGPGRLVVLDEDVAAVAVPGAGGRVLVSRAQLAALPPAERRALLAHERAHLVHRHHLYRLLAELAAALDPWQVRVPAAVRFATERWADEVAAAELGDRAAVARSLARSGLRALRPVRAPWAAVALGAGGSRVVQRVEALLAPAPRQRPAVLLAVLLVVGLGLGAAVHAQADTEEVVEHAAPSGLPAPG
ncbi:M48 family metalloprotease [Modestobacter sp. NPDC049651]|uniref:M48 family metalloprotease n=1 Tax=unclassified Modestobacter TaxID=2643866 RepID=UPI00340F0B89